MSTQLIQHHDYYIAGGDLYLQVEDTLFRVHSYFFERESSRYRDEVSAPVAPGTARLGSSLSNPLKIQNSNPQEFSKFLWVFCNKKFSMYKATSKEWVSILKIACEYDFPEVKALAIRGIEKGGNLSIFRLIYIYQLYKVDISYLIPLYITLCRREKPPTTDEAKELGLETALLIFRLREAVRSTTGGDSCRSPLPSNLEDDDILRTICTSLGIDHNIGGSLRRRSPTARSSLRLPRPMSRSPEAPRRRTSSMLETSTNREAFVFDQVVCPPGPGGCQYAAEEDHVAYKTFLGRIEDWQKGLNITNGPLYSTTFLRVMNYMVVARSNGVQVAILLVMPVRTVLFLVAVLWTIVFFVVYRSLPSNILLL